MPGFLFAAAGSGNVQGYARRRGEQAAHTREKAHPLTPLHRRLARPTHFRRPSRDPTPLTSRRTPPTPLLCATTLPGFGYLPRHPLLILVSLPTQPRHFRPMSGLSRPTNQDQQLSSQRVGRAGRRSHRDPISPSCHRRGVECGTKARTRRRAVHKVPHSTSDTRELLGKRDKTGHRTNQLDHQQREVSGLPVGGRSPAHFLARRRRTKRNHPPKLRRRARKCAALGRRRGERTTATPYPSPTPHQNPQEPGSTLPRGNRRS